MRTSGGPWVTDSGRLDEVTLEPSLRRGTGSTLTIALLVALIEHGRARLNGHLAMPPPSHP